ncbi:MAG: hypothetical protein JO257_31390 [Deltaproteobacteria bacterium]|nr:hypothetical protein [Deltaproteobacteria bacterium]
MRAAAMLLVAGCVVGPPKGYGPGESWTFPLVDPLANGVIVAPATIAKGTMLFALGVTPNGTLWHWHTGAWTPERYARLGAVQLGTLHVNEGYAYDLRLRVEDARKRYIAGRLDVLSASLAFGFDRDAGVGWLATANRAQIPAGARSFELKWHRLAYATAKVDGVPRDLMLDLMDGHSRLRTAGRHEVTIGDVTRFGVDFAGLDDVPWFDSDFDGILGLDFFRDFNVTIDLDAERVYVSPRHEVAPAARIARWNLACPHTGCAQLALHGRRIDVTPEHVPLQVVFAATTPGGARLPPLELDIDSGGGAPFALELPAEYADAALAVIDASPFPRLCDQATACVAPY